MARSIPSDLPSPLVPCVLAVLGLLGCQRAPTEDAPPPPRLGAAPPSTAADEWEPRDALEGELKALVAREASFMIPVGETHRLSVPAGESRDVQIVLPGGHCFKVLGVASERLEELSLRIVDANAVPLQQAQNGRATVLGNEPLCFEAPGLFRVQARALRGEGDVALRAYRSR